MKTLSIFYKIAIILALGICAVSINQSYNLRNELKSVRITTSHVKEEADKMIRNALIAGFEDGYKESTIDSYFNENKYLIKEENNKLTLWKYEKIIEKNKTRE